MKTIIRTLVVFIAMNLSFAIYPEQASAQHAYVSIKVFYDQLGPYGRWIAYPHYGYVWVPNVGPDFMPYTTNGYWVYTDYGWTWVSDYSWGWAPFHYGRWDYDNFYGWFWVPDNEWGPAWVVWRQADGYYGWAPMKPGYSIDVVYGKGYDIPFKHWVFVRDRDFERHDLHGCFVERDHNAEIIHNSRIIRDTHFEHGKRSNYFHGPNRDEVQKNTGKNVRRVSVHNSDQPERREIKNDKLEIYRPQIQKKETNHENYSPKPVEKWQRNNQHREKGVANQQKSNNRSERSQQKNDRHQDNRKDSHRR
jgi:hypothetical protein